MKIDKIDVQTSNKKHATDISMLVDKPEFLQELNKLREKWQIKQLYKLKTTPFQEILNIDNVINSKITDFNEAQKRVEEFYGDVEKVLKRFSRGKNFRPVVAYAFATGTVPEGVYRSCYFDLVTINEPEDLSKPEKYQYVIVMSPRTEKQEVEETFKEFKEHIQAKINFESRELSKMKERGTLITDQELEELKKQALLLETEYIKYRKKIENAPNAPISDKVSEYSKFSERTQSMRDKYAELRHKFPVDSNYPDDMDLIEQYHKGNIFNTADISKFKKKTDIDRVREWYWIKNKKYFNGETSKPLSYPEVLDEWLNTCPVHKASKEHDLSDVECPKCTFFEKKIRKDKRIKEGGGSYNNVEKALEAYTNLLNNS